MTPSENRPHVVYCRRAPRDAASVHPNYASAYAYWCEVQSPFNPWVICALDARVIHPETPIIDVNE